MHKDLLKSNQSKTRDIIVVQVIAESEQLRMDSDDLGPRAELDYWKKRMSCCNYLLDQIKSPEVNTVFGVLLMSKSKLMKVSLFFFFFMNIFFKSVFLFQYEGIFLCRHGKN